MNMSAAEPMVLSGNWIQVGRLDDIPRMGARVVECSDGNIAVFRTSSDEVFALQDQCPHRGGPLSQGIVHGRRVACPLHDWKIHLDTGLAVTPDEGCTASYPVRIENGLVLLSVVPNPVAPSC